MLLKTFGSFSFALMLLPGTAWTTECSVHESAACSASPGETDCTELVPAGPNDCSNSEQYDDLATSFGFPRPAEGLEVGSYPSWSGYVVCAKRRQCVPENDGVFTSCVAPTGNGGWSNYALMDDYSYSGSCQVSYY